MRAGLHEFGDRASVARALDDEIGDQRDRFWMVELDAALEPAARDHGRHRDQELILFPRRQIHGALSLLIGSKRACKFRALSGPQPRFASAKRDNGRDKRSRAIGRTTRREGERQSVRRRRSRRSRRPSRRLRELPANRAGEPRYWATRRRSSTEPGRPLRPPSGRESRRRGRSLSRQRTRAGPPGVRATSSPRLRRSGSRPSPDARTPAFPQQGTQPRRTSRLRAAAQDARLRICSVS